MADGLRHQRSSQVCHWASKEGARGGVEEKECLHRKLSEWKAKAHVSAKSVWVFVCKSEDVKLPKH